MVYDEIYMLSKIGHVGSDVLEYEMTTYRYLCMFSRFLIVDLDLEGHWTIFSNFILANSLIIR